MADINLNFGMEDNIKKVLDIVKEVDKIIKGIKDSGIVTKDDDMKLKEYVAASLKINNELEKQEKTKKRLETQDQKAAAKLKEQSGIIGGLEKQVKEYTAAWKAANTEAEKKAAKKNLDDIKKKLTEAKDATASWTKALGSFQFKFNALGNIAANVVSKGFQMLNRAMRDSVKIVIEFDKAQAMLASISGKTRSELSGLTNQAKQLGMTTRYTATEVTNLQIELGKLGFVAEEIKNSTPAILDFATATGADLPSAAKVAGIAVRAFGLSTQETADAVATMAVATTKSALQFSDFETILSTVGPVARAYGFTLQDTVALLGKLRDAGFDASSAATATRNIFLNLADSGGRLAKALGKTPETFDEMITGMIELRGRGVNLNDTLEMTDKRSVAAFNQFLNTAEGAKELRTAITGVRDEMQEMVEKQMDTLSGSLINLKSSWEGFILSLEEGQGVIANLVTGSLHILTDALMQLGNTDLMLTRTSKLTEDQVSRTYDVLMNFTRAKEGLNFQNVIKQFNELNYVLIKFDDSVKKNFETAMKEAGFNSRETSLLWDEYVKRRKEQFEDEIKATEAYQQRKTEQLEKEQNRIKSILESYKDVAEMTAEEFDNLYDSINNALGDGFADIVKKGDKTMKDYHKEFWSLRMEDRKRRQQERDEQDSETERQKNILLDAERTFQQEKLNTFYDFTNAMQARNRMMMDQELSNTALTEEEKNRIRTEYAKRGQNIAIAEAMMNAAVGAVRVWKEFSNPLIAVPIIGLIAAQAAAQIATIKAQKFAKGGEIGGKPHSQGGTTIEVERGEFVVKKSAYQRNKELVQAINNEDSLRIAEMMSKDRKIIITKQKDYTKELYELLSSQEHGYETPEFYVIQKGNRVMKLRKPGAN